MALRRVLQRCLRKDPRKRLRDIGDAALELRGEFEDEPAAAIASTTAPASSRRPWLIGATGLALGLILATAISIKMRPTGADTPLTWSSLPAPAENEYEFASFLELSPDGRRVVFVAPPADGEDPLLWVRELGQEQARPLAGTKDAYQCQRVDGKVEQVEKAERSND